MSASGFHLDSIDEYLGPAETRFFSRGYQRATYGVRNVDVDQDQRAVSAQADLRYPADWSRKAANTDLRPHLSTIDALVLGVQLAELELVHSYALDASARQATRLRKVTLRAGNAPQEDLTGVLLSAKHLKTVAGPDSADRADRLHREHHECRVGNLRVRTEIERPASDPSGATGPIKLDSIVAALGPDRERFYGTGFQRRRHVIENVRVDLRAWTADATARFVGEAADAREGVDGGIQPSASLLDCFVVNLQLAQVLMYELDAIRRSESGTLWMMQTVLTRETEPESLTESTVSMPAQTAITSKKLLSLRGSTWRTVELRGALGGMSLRCSFAHELPQRVAATAS